MTNHFPESEDKGYRRGFDQGVATLAYALGIPNGELQKTLFKERCTSFRHGRIEEAPSKATKEESMELLSLVQLGRTQ